MLRAGPAPSSQPAGIFLLAFIVVALSGPVILRLRQSPMAGAALDGLNIASFALMAVVCVELAREALPVATTIALAAGAFVLLIRYRVIFGWLVFGGAATGLLVSGLR